MLLSRHCAVICACAWAAVVEIGRLVLEHTSRGVQVLLNHQVRGTTLRLRSCVDSLFVRLKKRKVESFVAMSI
ncbi:uncharacterized protein M421DRAFT_426248, partial [Didymella exigua CBS 183.55]